MTTQRDPNAELVARDLACVWHPCSQMKDHEWLPMVPIRRGAGAWLEDFNGRHYLDCISSWWVNLFGHANPVIGNAVRRQLETLEHVMLAGFTHEPVIELSERLVAATPAGLDRCFYADNGSSAVEVALKMSFHYWLNQGEPQRKRFVALENSYHGETLGALAVGDVALYKETYQPLLMDCLLAPTPDAYQREAGESPADFARRRARELEALLERHAGEVCAVIVEPLVQCAGHMRMHDPAYLVELRAICDRHRVHLIADEIAVGFGRTGTLFACEQADISPDFLCLSKGLTGGFLPLSVVLTSNEVYEAFYDDYTTLRAFLHSHSYTGNPLACAAALATLDLFAASDVLGANRKRAALMRAGVAELEDHPHVAEIRQAGMILAIELVKDRATRQPYPWQERRGLRVYQYGLQHDMLLRPLGHVVYFMPPYVIDAEEIALMTRVAIEGIDAATRAD
ncbi:MAG: adenosylmethionine--8-amino-7-oxononanoate transaminase [Gammaproteobacteria bacterium]